MFKLSKYFVIYIIFLLVIGFKGKIIAAFIFVILHELTHYLAARSLGFNGFDIKLLPIGAVLNLKDLDEASAKQDIIISLAGPLMNFILSLGFYLLFYIFQIEMFYTFYLSNLALGIFNLIPAFPLDGGRILRDILSMKTLYKKANKITVNISIALGVCLMFLYFISFFSNKGNITIGLISLFIIITSIKEKERIAYFIMGDIIKKKYKFISRGYIENKSISIYYKKDILTALGLFDKNKYNVFMVLNADMNVIDIVYEEELVEALRDHGNMTLEEFIDKNNKIVEAFNNIKNENNVY